MTQSLATAEVAPEGLAARLQREARERKQRFFGPQAKKPKPPAAVVPLAPAIPPTQQPYGVPVAVVTKAVAAIDSFNFHSHCPSLQLIFRMVAHDYGVTPNEILSSRRDASIVRPRQVAMYLSKILTTRSLPEIGRRIGGKDHTTVLHAVRKIEGLIEADAELAARVAHIAEEVRGSLARSHGAEPISTE